MLQGKVVTETTTEYKEATDDSGFSDFGLNAAQQFPGFQLKSEVKPAESSSSSSSEDEDEDKAEAKFQEEALKAHNEFRANHGVTPLKLDKKVRIKHSGMFCKVWETFHCAQEG